MAEEEKTITIDIEDARKAAEEKKKQLKAEEHEKKHREHLREIVKKKNEKYNYAKHKKNRLKKMYQNLSWPENSLFITGIKFLIWGAIFMLMITISQIVIVTIDIINHADEAFDEEIFYKLFSIGSTFFLLISFLRVYNNDVNILRFARHYVRVAYDAEEQTHHELDLDHINFDKLNVAFAKWSIYLRLIFVAAFISVFLSLTSINYHYNWEVGAKYLSIVKNMIIIIYVVISALFVSTVRRPDLYPQIVFEEDHVWQKVKVKDLTPEQLKKHLEKKGHHSHGGHDSHGHGHKRRHDDHPEHGRRSTDVPSHAKPKKSTEEKRKEAHIKKPSAVKKTEDKKSTSTSSKSDEKTPKKSAPKSAKTVKQKN